MAPRLKKKLNRDGVKYLEADGRWAAFCQRIHTVWQRVTSLAVTEVRATAVGTGSRAGAGAACLQDLASSRDVTHG